MESRTYSVVVLDDNPADLLIVREAFAECGFRYQLRTASSLEEAQQLGYLGEKVDLLLSDLGTDVEEGRRFIRAVRAQSQTLPIIILSAGYNSDLAYECGANAYVHKPNDWEQFVAKIKGIMAFWIDIAELPSSSSIMKKNP